VYNSAYSDSRYRCVRKLGKGGTSTVYLCVDNHIGKKWAVKLILPDKNDISENRDLFISEITTLKSIDYYMFPRITDAFFVTKDAYECNDSVQKISCDKELKAAICIVTDYIEGETLESYLKREGPLDEYRAFGFFEELLKALIYLHTRDPGILYLDMKPANIMITPDGQPRLIDFGIACTVLTKSRCYGSPGYAAPEQYLQDSILNEKADVFALGMTLYAMLTAKVPRTEYEIQRQIIQKDQTISEYSRKLILKCIDRNQLYRPAPEKLLSMLNIYRLRHRGVSSVIITTAAVITVFSVAVYTANSVYKAQKAKRYTGEMVNAASEYLVDGQYTRQGIRIICGYIDSDFLDESSKSKYSYEVARYYFDEMKEYSTAAHYFALTDINDYPEAEYYREQCEKMKSFNRGKLEK